MLSYRLPTGNLILKEEKFKNQMCTQSFAKY